MPLSAAVVELAGLDMRTTPLDRMTCIYDTVEQVGVHIREAVLEAHADSEDRNSESKRGCNRYMTSRKLRGKEAQSFVILCMKVKIKQAI